LWWRRQFASPLRHDLIDVQRAEACRRSLHHSRVDLGDLDVERGDPTSDGQAGGEFDLGRRI
jgi:hypothetical protein